MSRYLALYMGTLESAAQQEWENLSEDEKAKRSTRAMAAWEAWVEQHEAAITDMGGPLGKTLLASTSGISPTRNAIAAYVIVEADSHEDAARMFENHPHFAIFPGTGVEILECLPMPGA
ncbi:hypothetical protein [Devosia faecipullorum]|uniref:hypothetical protein n=1 Tax=Devosia faecipullorum TaxID=2755039 RepID=UPI00187BA4C1|nr:hypothetical protein [Devosia faecipullorum]MBE7732421.1 hypothetical protein [Devosia faecipullorum]